MLSIKNSWFSSPDLIIIISTTIRTTTITSRIITTTVLRHPKPATTTVLRHPKKNYPVETEVANSFFSSSKMGSTSISQEIAKVLLIRTY